MPSESKPALTIQTEKPNHYSYLKEFRVEQCTQFLQHKCTNHRPFTCFHWHFNNQRRRRPVRKRDGSFNYSPDSYCAKYDETTGICPDGDDCPLLHRTAGDTERRYHLRYYKTCMCVHDTDSRGYCVKNGPHCAFAHGSNDLRPPVYDVKELQAMENADSDSGTGSNGPNVLDKERNLMNEDPKWQDTNYVLANYKTEQCKRPPRLCRQGYACPQYHNSRDKRRSPTKYKYRSTPCPSVKHGDEWGETSNCDAGDNCGYCHTRTEQQFHPEIYKSTRCNDVQITGYCPRGVFCAFAHQDQEMTISREAPTLLELKTNLADILSNALPQQSGNHNDSREEVASSSPDEIMSHHLAVNNDTGLPNIENDKQHMFMTFMNNDVPLRMNFMTSESHLGTGFYNNDSMDTFGDIVPRTGKTYSQQLQEDQMGLNDYNISEAALEDLTLDDPVSLATSIEKDIESDSPTANSITQGIQSSVLGSSAPMNIPGCGRSMLSNFSPPTSSPLPALQPGFLQGSAFHDSIDTGSMFMNHIGNKIGSFPSSSGGGGLYNFSSAHMSPTGVPISSQSRPTQPPISAPHMSNMSTLSPSIMQPNSNDSAEFAKLRDELNKSKATLSSWEDRVAQARKACEAWRHEAEMCRMRTCALERQHDEALLQVETLKKEIESLKGDPYMHALNRLSEVKEMPLHVLQSLQSKLKKDLEDIEKIIGEKNKNASGNLVNNR